MAEQYAGLCVGGPLAGQSIAHFRRTLPITERSHPMILEHYDSAVESRRVPIVEPVFKYNWHHTGAQGFWIPEGQSLHDAINTMAQAYMEKCNADRR